MNRKKNDCRGSCFSQTLQSLEVGYGPITAPSVSVTGAGPLICACFRYCHLEKKKKKKRERQRETDKDPSRRAVSQDRRPTRCTAPSTPACPENKRLSGQDVKTGPPVRGGADKLGETGPPVQNKQRSLPCAPPVSSHSVEKKRKEKKNTLGDT